MGTLESAVMAVLVLLVLFFVLRQLFLWYWKVDEAIKLLREIRDSIRSGSAPAATAAPAPPPGEPSIERAGPIPPSPQRRGA